MSDLKTEIRAVLKASMGNHDMATECVMNLISQQAAAAPPVVFTSRELRPDPIGVLPRNALREFIEAQIPDDEDRQMTAYGQAVTFIEQLTAAPAVVRVERPEVEAPDFSAFDDPITIRAEDRRAEEIPAVLNQKQARALGNASELLRRSRLTREA